MDRLLTWLIRKFCDHIWVPCSDPENGKRTCKCIGCGAYLNQIHKRDRS